MHLPLLEEAIATNPEALRKVCAVLTNRVVVIAYMETEVERVVRRDADPTRACCKRMNEAMPIQKGRMQSTHIVLFSTP